MSYQVFDLNDDGATPREHPATHYADVLVGYAKKRRFSKILILCANRQQADEIMTGISCRFCNAFDKDNKYEEWFLHRRDYSGSVWKTYFKVTWVDTTPEDRHAAALGGRDFHHVILDGIPARRYFEWYHDVVVTRLRALPRKRRRLIWARTDGPIYKTSPFVVTP